MADRNPGIRVTGALLVSLSLAQLRSASLSLAQPDFTAQCINARSAGAQAIMIVMDGGSLGRIARDCGRQSFHPALWTGASVFTDSQKSNPDLDGIRAVAQTFPWMLSATPAQQAYQQALKRYDPGAPPAGTASMAWWNVVSASSHVTWTM